MTGLHNKVPQIAVKDILDLGWIEEEQTPAMKKTRQRRFKRDEFRFDIWASRTMGMYEIGTKAVFRYDVSDEDIFEAFIDPSYFKKIP